MLELKNSNKILNDNLVKLINENSVYKKREAELNHTITENRLTIEELQLKNEGIDIDNFKKENDILKMMTKE